MNFCFGSGTLHHIVRTCVDPSFDNFDGMMSFASTGSGCPGRLSTLCVSHSESVAYGAFVWECMALNS